MTAPTWKAALLFGITAAALSACAGSHQANPVPAYAPDASTRAATARTAATTSVAAASMCSIYSGFGALSFCYDFDETSGTTLLDSSGSAHNGTIAASGVTYGAAGITSNSTGAETTDGSAGSMTSGIAPASGSFSFSFFVNLKSNANNYARLAATGDPKNSSNHSGWYVAVNSGSTNPIFASIGSGSGSGTSVGFIPLALNTPANVTLTYNASSNMETLCVSTGSTPTCSSTTLPAAYLPSGNAITYGGAPKYYSANATFDESAYYAGTVLTNSQITTIASYAGAGGTATPTPAPTSGGKSLCSTYAGFGSPAFCYEFDEASGTTLTDASSAGHNGTIASSGVTYRAPSIATGSVAAETTDGTNGSMTSGFVPTSGSFSLSFYVNLKSNANGYGRLAATGDPKNSSNHSGWYVAVNSGSTNPIFASIGSGSGTGTSVGFIPLALNTPANVSLTYDASSNQETLCVATNSSPTCASQTLPAAYVPSGNAITFGGAPKYYPANASFDEAAYFQGTVLSSTQTATLGGDTGSGSGAAPTPTPIASPAVSPTPIGAPTASPTPTASGSASFNNWVTHDYNNTREGYNPNSTLFTPANLTKLHLAWQKALPGGNQGQPLLLTNVAGHAGLLIVESAYTVSALDATSGAQVWSTTIGKQYLQDCGNGGVGGTPAYDPALSALIVAGGNNGANPNHAIVSKLDVATGNVISSFDATPTLLQGEALSVHSAMTFANGYVYMGTSSSCVEQNWRGRVLAIDPVNMDVAHTFFTTYGHGDNYGGGSIWAEGGLAADASGNIYFGTGNAETPMTESKPTSSPYFNSANTNEQAGYAEHIVKMSSDLSTVLDSNYPGFNFTQGYKDLDFPGVPVLFQPSGCNQLSGTQGKGGTLVIHDTTNLSNPTSYTLSDPAPTANYIGSPGYSPVTGLLYAAVASSMGGSLEPPGAVAIQFSCPSGSSSILWHTAFGPDSFSYSGTKPRSQVVATAGGIVFVGSPCTTTSSGGCGTPGALSGAMWALNASTGAVLGGGNPILYTGDNIRLGPVVDGQWMYVQDNSGNLYALTLDSTVPTASIRPGHRDAERRYKP